jgi:hypothetical protein
MGIVCQILPGQQCNSHGAHLFSVESTCVAVVPVPTCVHSGIDMWSGDVCVLFPTCGGTFIHFVNVYLT